MHPLSRDALYTRTQKGYFTLIFIHFLKQLCVCVCVIGSIFDFQHHYGIDEVKISLIIFLKKQRRIEHVERHNYTHKLNDNLPT